MEEPRLYGRDREVATLKECYYDAVSGTSKAQLVLVSGVVGMGKRALVSAIKHDVATTGGIVLSGRCRSSEHCTKIPVRPLAVVCRALQGIDKIMTEERRSDFRTMLYSEFPSSDEREIIIDMLESTGQILLFEVHDSPSNAAMAGTRGNLDTTTMPPLFADTTSTSKKHLSVFLRFVHAVALFQPLALSLEDMHFADTASVELIEMLLDDKMLYQDGKGLLIVASYDANAELSERFALFLDQIDTRISELGKKVNRQDTRRIMVSNLSLDDVIAWLLDRFSTLREREARSLAKMLYNKSNGCPMYVQTLIQLISQDASVESTDNNDFRYLTEKLHKYNTSDEVYLDVLKTQKPTVQHVVETVALLQEFCEYDVKIEWLDMVLQHSSADDIKLAQEAALLLSASGSIQLPHMELQSKVYHSIEETKCKSNHLIIGRRLWKYSGQASSIDDQHTDTTFLFMVAQNLQCAIGMVDDVKELEVIASIFMRAGKRAMKLSHFALAASLFDSAISALGEEGWTTRNYQLTLELFYCGSEAYYAAADYSSMSCLLDKILEKATSLEDKLQAYTTQVFANGAQHRLQEAITLAFDVLTTIGEPVRASPSKFSLQVQFWRIQKLLRAKTIRSFSSLPAATSVTKVTAMQLLAFIASYSFVVQPEISMVSTMQILRLILKFGIAAPAVPAIAAFGAVLCLHKGEFELGDHCGQIATALFEQFHPIEARAWFPRVTYFTHGNINRWVHPFRASLDLLLAAHHSGLASGDIEGSMFTGGIRLELAFLAGNTLCQIEQETRLYCQLMDSLGQIYGLVFLVPFHAFLCDLLGKTEPPLGVSLDVNTIYTQAVQGGNKFAVRCIVIYQMIMSYLSGNYQDALDSFMVASEAHSSFDVLLMFYGGLTTLAAARDATGFPRRKYKRMGLKLANQLKHLARICPANYRNKHALLEAEMAALAGNTTRALTRYNESIKAAQEECFVHEEAIAYMRLAEYQRFIGGTIAAAPFIGQARSALERWGAQALVDNNLSASETGNS